MGWGSGIQTKPTPDPESGVKEAPDPGSATLIVNCGSAIRILGMNMMKKRLTSVICCLLSGVMLGLVSPPPPPRPPPFMVAAAAAALGWPCPLPPPVENTCPATRVKALLCIPIDFNADPDPGSQTNADPGQTLKDKKYNFYFT
jgi:hypothetical protein